MSEFISYNGDHLLDVFKDLNIDLGGLHPNVVKAWFDTDDEDVINLLNFMCSSLSRENMVSAQELAEFESLEDPKHDSQLDKAFRKLEVNNPGIFNYEVNSKQLKISLAELELLKQEEQRLCELEKIEDLLQQTLLQDKLRIERESAELDFKYGEALERCENLSNKLDETNQKLHEKLSRNIVALANFQSSDFLNRKNLDEIHDSAEFHKTIEDMVRKQHDELSGYFSLSDINLNSTPNKENCGDKLEMLKNQIFSSHMEYIEARMEAESLAEVHNFLKNFFTHDFLLDYGPTSLSDGLEQKEVLFSKLQKKVLILAEEPIISIKISKIQQELQDMQENLESFSQIAKYYSKLLCTTSCGLMLLLQEKNTIEEVDQGIRHIAGYILHDLEDAKDRQGLMLNIINSFNDFNRKPLEHRNKILGILVDMYGETMLKDAYAGCSQLNNKLRTLEHDHFACSQISEIVDKLYKTDLSKQFLTSGPTQRIVIIPNPIVKSLKNITANLDKQNAALKFLLYISNQTLKKLSSDKWLKNFRLVWVYFLVAPKKLKELLSEMDQELKRKEVKTVRFKD